MITIHVEYKRNREYIRNAGHNATHERTHIPFGTATKSFKFRDIFIMSYAITDRDYLSCTRLIYDVPIVFKTTVAFRHENGVSVHTK